EPRHRSLRAAIEWSYHLLTPELQRCFARLSIFCGGWSLEAAEAVLDRKGAGGRKVKSTGSVVEVLNDLEQLRSCSLVMVEESAPETPLAQTRFSMLDTLRQFAAEQVAPDERRALERRHTGYYLALAEQSETGLMSPEREEWLRRLEKDQDNFRAALQWSLEYEPEMALRLVGALWRFWEARGRFDEGRDWLERALSIDGLDSDNRQSLEWRAKALNGVGRLAWYRADFNAARNFLEQSLALGRKLGNQRFIANALHSLALVAMCQGDRSARELLEEGLAIGRQLQDKSFIKDLLLGLGLVVLCQADFAAARRRLEESLTLSEALADKRGRVFSLNNLGFVAYFQGDYTKARQLHETALAMLRELGEPWTIARALCGLGNVARAQGDYAAAHAALQECLRIHSQLKSKWEVPYGLEACAYLAVAVGQPERASVLLGAATALREAVVHPFLPFSLIDYHHFVVQARAELSARDFDRAWAKGRSLTIEHAIAFALEE
ncbi:MAG: tetratricopeptide repeat protein, partial [Armatimonadota bacterium]|nr:tetratricopeptide repeat protein [Armatimonadota bacterium]